MQARTAARAAPHCSGAHTAHEPRRCGAYALDRPQPYGRVPFRLAPNLGGCLRSVALYRVCVFAFLFVCLLSLSSMMHLDGCSVTFDKDSQSGLAFSVSPHVCPRTSARTSMRNTRVPLPISAAGFASSPWRGLSLGQPAGCAAHQVRHATRQTARFKATDALTARDWSPAQRRRPFSLGCRSISLAPMPRHRPVTAEPTGRGRGCARHRLCGGLLCRYCRGCVCTAGRPPSL